MSLNRDDVVRMLREASDRGASELHFKVPNRPAFRVDGALLPIAGSKELVPGVTQQVAMALCGLAGLELPLVTMTDHEFSFGLNGVGRFHVTLYRQRGTVAVIVQRSGLKIPLLRDLGFGLEAERVIARPGLVLVCGGERRHALLASLVDRFNAAQRGYAVTIEDRITYLHRDAMACIAQRGVGTDVVSMTAGVRAAIRQHPDLLACGEIADRDAAEAVLDAVEHGIPTLAMLVAPNAEDAAAWLARKFPIAERPDAEYRIDRVLKAVLALPDRGAAEFVDRVAGAAIHAA